MSLINDALKKAQAQAQAQQKQSAGAQGGPNYIAPAAEENRKVYIQLIVILAVIAGILGGILALVLFGFLSDSEGKPQPPVAQTPPPASEPSTPAAAAPAPQETAEKPNFIDEAKQLADDYIESRMLPEDAFPEHPAHRQQPAATTVAAAVTEPASPPEKPSASEPPAEETPAAEPTPPEATADTSAPSNPEAAAPPAKKSRGNPEVISFLKRLKVRGLMPGGERTLIHDPAVNQTYTWSENAVVNAELEIRIKRIAADSITFVDDAGITYIKYF